MQHVHPCPGVTPFYFSLRRGVYIEYHSSQHVTAAARPICLCGHCLQHRDTILPLAIILMDPTCSDDHHQQFIRTCRKLCPYVKLTCHPVLWFSSWSQAASSQLSCQCQCKTACLPYLLAVHSCWCSAYAHCNLTLHLVSCTDLSRHLVVPTLNWQVYVQTTSLCHTKHVSASAVLQTECKFMS